MRTQELPFPVEQLFLLVALCVSIWLVIGSTVVWFVRRRYLRTLEGLMREAASSSASQPAMSRGRALPEHLLGELSSALRGLPFVARHRLRLLIYLAGSVAFAVVFAIVNMTKIAVEEGMLSSWFYFLTSPDMLWTAGKRATIPAVAVLVILRSRRFQRQGSGIWVAALISVWLPFGKIQLNLGSTSLPKVLFYVGVGLVAGFAYVRAHAWYAARSSWSPVARALNTFFFAFCLAHVVVTTLLNWPWIWVATLLLPYAAYELTVRALFLFVPARRAARLLFLRVFGRPDETDSLYRALVYDWSLIGPVRLIGAPDIAKRTMNATALAEFLAGRLQRLFQWTRADLKGRMAKAERPYADKSYRTVEVLCSGDTWREAVQQLSEDIDVVVMDLRGFAASNLGCAWELGQLAELISLRRVLLCVDSTTQREPLEQALRLAWSSISDRSPNLRPPQRFQTLTVAGDFRRVAEAAYLLAEVSPSSAPSGVPAVI